jgi:hypothetical protein
MYHMLLYPRKLRVYRLSKLFATISRPAVWRPSSLLSNGYRKLFSRGRNWPGPETDHSLPSSAEGENTWSYTCTPQCIFTASCLIKQNIRLHGAVLNYAQGLYLCRTSKLLRVFLNILYISENGIHHVKIRLVLH